MQRPPGPFELSPLDRSSPGGQTHPPEQYRQFRSCAGLSTTVHADLTRRGGFYGRRLGEYFGVEATELLEINWRGKPALVVTRLTCSRPDRLGGGPISPEPAFSIFNPIADAEFPQFGFDCPPEAGGLHVMDLRRNSKCELTGPVDLLHYYVPCEALVALAREYPKSPVQTHLSVLAHFAKWFGELRARDSIAKSGLAPWQERRAKEMMRASLGSDLSIATIAAQCRLTPSHFGRYFKRSTGVTPYQYLTRLRLEEAKRLMLTTQHSLAEIALACGFGDQSYLTRIFSRNLGTSPAAWRRSRLQG
jgi:AraC family transcriptional regulator